MTNFDDIRPYYDSEIPAAMQRIADSEVLPNVAQFAFPDVDFQTLKEKIRSIRNTNELQIVLMKAAIEQILGKTVTDFTYSGMENLRTDCSYLFISNHRDIVLDAMLLQYILYTNHHTTCQITFGANLMCHPFVIDVGKANKMFRTERGGDRLEFYRNLMHMSEYMRHVITEEHESVWIAQRNGRTKNGIDATDPAIIKMFGMSRRDDAIKSLAELNIVPIAVSYEWESCDKLKALELYASRNAKYEKKPGEDLNSILTGIKQPKGRVHFGVGKPLTEDILNQLNTGNSNALYKNIAHHLDESIFANYLLTPNNFIAHDLRSRTSRFSEYYTESQKDTFIQYMNWMNECKDMDLQVLKDIFLGIYANPVEQKAEFKSK